jgi:hypothetical protein
LARGVGPTSEREHCQRAILLGVAFGKKTRMSLLVVAFTFGIFSAAVFAEPAIAEIEEVVGLIHKSKGTEVRGQRSGVRRSEVRGSGVRGQGSGVRGQGSEMR